jgi:hypothetical protein
MLDIETLGQGPNAVAWQTALYAVESDDPETLLPFHHHQYLPIPPQLNRLLPARKIDFSTLLFWFREIGKNPELYEGFEQCDSTDVTDLVSLLRHFVNAFKRFTMEGSLDYELWTRGNFDLPIMQTLLEQAGLEVPWDFRKTMDLRTLEQTSGVSYKSIPTHQGFIKHRADHDAIFQISHWAACMKALATGHAPDATRVERAPPAIG